VEPALPAILSQKEWQELVLSTAGKWQGEFERPERGKMVHPPEANASESPTVHAAGRSTGASSLSRAFPHDGNREEAPVLLLLRDLASESFVAYASGG